MAAHGGLAHVIDRHLAGVEVDRDQRPAVEHQAYYRLLAVGHLQAGPAQQSAAAGIGR